MNNMNADFFLIELISITVAGCAFLFWPRQIKLLGQRYDFNPYKGFAGSQYFLGIWPLFQSILVLLLPSSNEKTFVLLITSVVAFCQYLIIIKDRIFLEKIIFLRQLTREQVRGINKRVVGIGLPSFYGTTISLALFIRLGGWWTNQQLSNLLSLLVPMCVALYCITAGIGILLTRRAREKLENRK